MENCKQVAAYFKSVTTSFKTLHVISENNMSKFNSWLRHIVSSPIRIYIFIIPLYFTETLIEPFFPVTHALIGDWFTIINFIIIFLFGFLLMSVKDVFWLTVENTENHFS